MRKFILLALFAIPVLAAPPYNVQANFTPVQGATSYNLYTGCQAGESKQLRGNFGAPGQTLNAVISAAGTYSFCVHPVGAGGEGPVSNIVVKEINDVLGAIQDLQILITCSTLPSGQPSCVVIDRTP